MPASLRSEGVRVYPGIPFGFLSESAFGFAGILTHSPTAIALLRLAVPGGVSDSRDDQRDASRAPTAAASMAAIVMAFCCHGPLGRRRHATARSHGSDNPSG